MAKKSTKQTSQKTTKSKTAAARARAVQLKDRVATGHASGFMNFIREQGVVGLAVGLAIGTAAGDTVKKLVQAFIDPLVQLLIGSQAGLQSAKFSVSLGDRTADFAWGAFVSSLITLLAMALVVYAIVHMLKLDRLDKKKS